jgi:saccharopine dehydrogenase (NAD+, L-lysine-forming)
MKKVIVIGAGAQGNVVAGVLSAQDDIDTVMLADIDIDRANEIAEVLGSPKIKTVKVDASNLDALTAVVKKGGYDALVNVMITDFNRNIIEAALAAKVNYLDMASHELLECSRKTTPQDKFLVEQLDYAKDFEDAGLKAFILIGSDSGITNVMAKEAADELDEVDYIGIKDYGFAECDETVAHWSLPMFFGDCADEPIWWEGGEYKIGKPFSGEEEYYFRPPMDRKGKVYYHLHEEPITIPKFIGKPVKYCDFKMGDPSSEMWEFMIEGLGLMDEDPIDVKGVQVVPKDVFFELLPKSMTPKKCIELVESKRIFSRLPLAVDVKGKRDGKSYHYKLWTDTPTIIEACNRIKGTNDVSYLASLPISIATLMMLRGQLKKNGVFPAETLDKEEREIFFAGVKEWGIKVNKQVKEEK